jgi:cysteine synthase A
MQGGGLFATSVLDTIGNIPLIKIGAMYAKLETTNPIGRIKNRVALEIIESAERDGKLKRE